MKKLLLAFFLFSALISKAQIFAPPGAEWEYSFIYYGFGGTETHTYKYTNDTIINGFTCQKIKQTGGINLGWEYNFHSTDDQIYYYDPYTNSFQIIFDYSLNVGDVMHIHRNSCSSFDRQIIGKGTDIINGVSYRYLEYPNSNAFITNFEGKYYEKLGFLNSFFMMQLDCAPDGFYFICLSKYSDNSSQNALYDSHFCQSFVPTSITETETKKFSLYPNPITNGLLTIKSQSIVKCIELIDMLGQNVLSAAPVGNTVTIGSVAQGMYVARVLFVDGKVGYKRVVME